MIDYGIGGVIGVFAGLVIVGGPLLVRELIEDAKLDHHLERMVAETRARYKQLTGREMEF